MFLVASLFLVLPFLALCEEQNQAGNDLVSQHIPRMCEWIASYGGYVNEKRMEPFVGQNGVGIRVKECAECVRQGRLYPLYKSGQADHQQRYDPSETATQHYMYDSVYGVDPLLLVVPYKLHMNPFSELHADETKRVVSILFDTMATGYSELLAVALAMELRNESSLWRPYFNTLPTPESLPRFGTRLTSEEIEVLYALGNRHGLASTIETRKAAELEHFRFIRQTVPELQLDEAEFLFAIALINSRSFGESPKHFKRMPEYYYNQESLAVLIPYLDLYNHRQVSVLSNRYFYELNGALPFNDPKAVNSDDQIVDFDLIRLVYFATSFHDRKKTDIFNIEPEDFSVAPGEELFNSYHIDHLSTDHFPFYGFVVPATFNVPDMKSFVGQHDADLTESRRKQFVSSCVELESQLQLLTRHLQFTESSKCNLDFDYHKFGSVNSVGKNQVQRYIKTVERILSDYIATGQINPVMKTFIDESLALGKSAVKIHEGVNICRNPLP